MIRTFFIFFSSVLRALGRVSKFPAEAENSGNRLPSLTRPHLFAQTEQKYTHRETQRKPKQPKDRGRRLRKETFKGACVALDACGDEGNDVVKLTHSSLTDRRRSGRRRSRVTEK